MCFSTRSTAFLAIALGLAIGSSGCAYENTLMAAQAKTSLVGLSELELETCLGLPDKEATKGKTALLSYNATSARTVNLSIPIVNGIGVSIVGYCRATFRLENGRVAGVTYTGRRSAGGTQQRLRRPDARLPFPAKLGQCFAIGGWSGRHIDRIVIARSETAKQSGDLRASRFMPWVATLSLALD